MPDARLHGTAAGLALIAGPPPLLIAGSAVFLARRDRGRRRS